MKDNSIISGPSAAVQNEMLLLTALGKKSETASFSIPAIKGSSKGFKVKFDYQTSHESPKQDPNIMVWTPNSIQPKYSLPIYPGRFEGGNDVSISPDGKFAALALDGLTLLNLEDGTTKRITNSDSRLRGVTFSVDGKRLLTGSGQFDGNVAQVWEAETGKLLNTYETKAFFPSWSPDETKILYPKYRGNISAVFDIPSGTLKTFESEGIGRMTEIATFDRTGKRFLSISEDQKFNIWNVDSGKLEFYLQHNQISSGFPGAVGVFTPDNQKIITVARDLFIRLWSAKDGSPIDAANIASRHAFGQKPMFSDDGRRMILALQNGNAYMLNFDEDYSKLPQLSDPVPLAEAHAFLADDGKLKPLLLPLADVTSGEVMHDNTSVLLGSSNGIIAIYDIKTGAIKSNKFKLQME